MLPSKPRYVTRCGGSRPCSELLYRLVCSCTWTVTVTLVMKYQVEVYADGGIGDDDNNEVAD